ncbi:DUF5681 domain-containing protein [Edaphosphingomonas haloaromaticamans]|uniref:DUF5681 domain-containing protein n=1 Tax=Edaphosphingomonas haloaromaticamans TaxID=653954 RepID=A0A1S1H896_9SPHN|nr:DUF5681 domain-containing protein [Sphingomonas haloaromaticamans]OHT18265.1 hypothetical protein BHE75_00236 [Sphingomonas haloaromaticamans]
MTGKNRKQESGEPQKWGKGKTDPDTWWKKGGPSPNPKGRPKGSKNQKTLYREAFEAKVTVNMDGEQRTMTKRALGYHQLAQKAAAGDLKAFQIQKELDERFDPPETVPPTPEESAADFATLEAWVGLREKFRVFQKPEDENG